MDVCELFTMNSNINLFTGITLLPNSVPKAVQSSSAATRTPFASQPVSVVIAAYDHCQGQTYSTEGDCKRRC